MGRQLNKYVASQLEQKAIPRIKRPKAAQILVSTKDLSQKVMHQTWFQLSHLDSFYDSINQTNLQEK